MAPGANATGLHWQVSQATSLMNITVNMSTHPSSIHQGKTALLHEAALVQREPSRYFHGEWERWIHGRYAAILFPPVTRSLITFADLVFNGGTPRLIFLENTTKLTNGF